MCGDTPWGIFIPFSMTAEKILAAFCYLSLAKQAGLQGSVTVELKDFVHLVSLKTVRAAQNTSLGAFER